MKLWVDDIRPAPKGWTRAETISEAINLINLYGKLFTHVSLDHDISIPVKVDGEWYNRPSPDTFKVVAEYYVEWYHNREHVQPPVFTTHSSNPEGRKKIQLILFRVGITVKETPAEQINRDNSNKK